MDPLEERTTTTARGMTYRYYVSAGRQYSGPALLCCHGFPDTAHLWAPLIPTLTRLPNRLLIPDLLGFGRTSKPKEPTMYAYHLMVQDLTDLCAAEDIEKVVVIGHDHGSGLAARFYNHAPRLTVALVLLNVAYQVPNKQKGFDLSAVNAAATKAWGYPIFEYWNFLTAPDAADIMNANLERLYDCAHAGTFETKKQLYCVSGTMKQYLTDHSVPRISIKSYATDPDLKRRWMSEFSAGGLAGPLCWYTSRTQDVQYQSDSKIADANMTVNVPVLFIGCDEDTVCRMEMIDGPRNAGLLPDLIVKTMHGVAHWPMYERPEDTAELISEFLRGKGL